MVTVTRRYATWREWRRDMEETYLLSKDCWGFQLLGDDFAVEVFCPEYFAPGGVGDGR